MPMTPNSKRCFTLVEMLAVLSIMLVVMAMSGPAFTKMFAGTSVESASRMVGSQLRLARQYAITQRKRIAVLLPGNQGGGTHADKMFMAMRVCEVDSSNVFVRWIENTKWGFFPQGAVVYEIDITSGLTSAVSGSIADDCEEVTGISGFPGDCRAIIFRPTGRPVGGNVRQYIHILEGAYATGDKPIVRNQDNWVEIEVEQYTGRLAFSLPEEN